MKTIYNNHTQPTKYLRMFFITQQVLSMNTRNVSCVQACVHLCMCVCVCVCMCVCVCVCVCVVVKSYNNVLNAYSLFTDCCEVRTNNHGPCGYYGTEPFSHEHLAKQGLITGIGICISGDRLFGYTQYMTESIVNENYL